MSPLQSRIQRAAILFLLLWLFLLCYSWRAIFRQQEERFLNDPTNSNNRRHLNHHPPEIVVHHDRPSTSHDSGVNVHEEPMKHRAEGKYHHRHTYKVKKAKKKFNHPDINLPLPVLAVGFPKAGTSSIFTFFQQQKFRSQHWYCCKAQRDPQRGGPFLMADCLLRHMGHVSQNKTDDKTMLEQCGNFDVFAEINGPRCSDDGNKGCRLEDGTMDTSVPNQQRIFLPQHFNLDFLHDAAPNSTWILNTRLVSDWVESVMNWSDLQHQFANEYHAQGLLDTLPSNETDMKAFLEEIFLNHTEHVKDFVSRHPSHALIEINITDSGAGEVLAESFGLDSSFWTVKNSRWRITWQQSIRFFGGGTWWLMFIATTAYMCSTLGLAMTFV